jgi:hypothetical protein
MKTKYLPNGDFDKEKARLVVQGCLAIKGRDYDQTRAVTCKMSTIREVMALMLAHGWVGRNSDIKQAFLHSKIDRDNLYIRLPAGLDFKDVEFERTHRAEIDMGKSINERCLVLRKGMYGLAQAPLLWGRMLAKHLEDLGFTRSRIDPMTFYKREGNDFVVLCCYVDDVFYTGNNPSLIDKAYKDIKEKFDMTPLANFTGFLGMNMERVDDHTMDIDMTAKIAETLEPFETNPDLHLRNYDSPGTHNAELEDDNDITTPTVAHCLKNYMNIVGELNYHVRTWRPDLCNTLSRLSRYLQDTPVLAGRMLVRALGYVKKTRNWKLRLRATSPSPDIKKPLIIEAWCDSNFADKSDPRARSHMGWNVSVNGVLIVSKSNRQTFTANSTHEAEVVACHECMEQIMLTAALFKEFGFEVQVPTILHCDNNSAVSTYATEVAEWRTPTLATKYWHSRDHVDSGDIKVVYIDTKSNNADVHTKWLPNQDHLRHAHWLGLRPPSGSSGT